MPLNPPSWTGQDIWYSTNVFVNKVQVALWQPPQAMSSAMAKIPVIPSPPVEFSKAQQKQVHDSIDDQEVDDGTGKKVRTKVGDGPYQGKTTTGVNPESLPTGVDPYSNFIKNCAKVLSEAEGGAWQGSAGNPNIQTMCSTTGVSIGLVISPNQLWCATFVGYMLKISGLPFSITAGSNTVSTGAAAYQNYGRAIDARNPSTWRKGDVMVVTRPKGGGFGEHVAFFWGGTSARGLLFGGNQGGKVSANSWYPGWVHGSGNQHHVIAVRRNWDIPTELDKPIIT